MMASGFLRSTLAASTYIYPVYWSRARLMMEDVSAFLFFPRDGSLDPTKR